MGRLVTNGRDESPADTDGDDEIRGRSLAGDPCGLSRHKARHSPEVSEPAEELRVPVPITKVSGADSDFP